MQKWKDLTNTVITKLKMSWVYVEFYRNRQGKTINANMWGIVVKGNVDMIFIPYISIIILCYLLLKGVY